MDEEILPITALTEEEIIKNNYSLNQLWMISFQEKVQGPFLESQLKKIFIENKELKLKSFQFCNLEKEKWVSLENTNFLGTDKVYMIVNTSDQIKFDDIVKLVLEKEIDENILISSDAIVKPTFCDTSVKATIIKSGNTLVATIVNGEAPFSYTSLF